MAGGRYPQAVKDYILAHHEGISYQELANQVNATFGTAYTGDAIGHYCWRHDLGRQLDPDCKYRPFPQEIREFIEMHQGGMSRPTLTKEINSVFGTAYTERQIYDYCKRHKLDNKKIGLRAPIGYEYITVDGYIVVKTHEREPGKSSYVSKQRLVWEASNGKIPEGCSIIFLDGDKTNCALENLQLVTKAELGTMSTHRLFHSAPELTKTGALVAKVITTAKKRKENKTERMNQND